MKRCSTVLALVATLVTTLGVAGPASADAGFPIPDHATVTLEGDGFGHGVGMSQYGAYGAARQGLGFKQILRFYYPGTNLGDTDGQVKVLVSADDRDLVVDTARGLTVRALKSGKSWKPAVPRASRWRLVPSGTRTQVSYRTSSWHSWRTVAGDVQLSAGSRPLTLRTPDGPVAYRGALRSTYRNDSRVTVNVVPMESYVRGVVPSEMYASWPQQALRAQTVASRTYAAYEREHTTNTAYDLCDTAACQAYGGYSAESGASDDAVAATARKVLTYQGKTAFAQFSASNGGWTVAGQVDKSPVAYLPAQHDPYEGSSPDYYGWKVDLTTEEIEQAYNLGNLTYLGIETRNDGGSAGHVLTVRIKTEGGFDDTVTGESFFKHFDLRSTMFKIDSVQ